MTVLVTDCAGLWRRTLLIEADGSRNTSTNVVWLQGLTAYVDSRGFAGRLDQDHDVFQWSRDIDMTPPAPFPDAGRMHWQGGVLVEVGVHAPYVEHWVRPHGRVTRCAALFLRRESERAILLTVGEMFGWADGNGVRVGDRGGPEWVKLAPHWRGDGLDTDGVEWCVEDSEGQVDL